MSESFEFFNPGTLVDDDLELILVEKSPGNPEKKYDPCYHFEMRSREKNQKMGTIRLRIGAYYGDQLVKYWGHIGYDVDPAFRGNSYAARSCKLLFPLAKRHGMNTIWITCNPDNLASHKVCQFLGGKFVETVDVPVDSESYQKGERQKCRYRIDL